MHKREVHGHTQTQAEAGNCNTQKSKLPLGKHWTGLSRLVTLLHEALHMGYCIKHAFLVLNQSEKFEAIQDRGLVIVCPLGTATVG